MPSKLCPHIQILDGVTLDAITRIQPPMVKIVDPTREGLQSLRAAAPKSLLVGRLYVASQDYASNPIAAGRAYADSYQNVLDLVDVVEVFNEAVNNSTSPANLARFDEYQVAFANRIWELNPQVKIGLFCLPTGNWGYPGEPKFSDCPKSMALPKNKVYLCVHEYSWYTWDWQSPARCLRYRQQMQGLSGYTVLITECGLTRAVLPGEPDLGWRTGIPRQVFIDGAVWYDSQMHQDAYVLGAAMFTCGASYNWSTFECTAEWEEATRSSPAIQPAYQAEWLDYEPPAKWVAGERSTASVKVRNAGTVTWDARRVSLGYHWQTLQGQPVKAVEDLRTPLPVNVAPGMVLSLTQAQVAAPPAPGEYILKWDLVNSDGTWFAERGSPTFNVGAKVQPRDTRPPDGQYFPETGFTVKGAFLATFRQYGLEVCGYPITNTLTESGVPVQYFQNVEMEEYAPGKIRFKPIGAEAFANQAQIAALETQVKGLSEDVAWLQARINELSPGG